MARSRQGCCSVVTDLIASEPQFSKTRRKRRRSQRFGSGVTELVFVQPKLFQATQSLKGLQRGKGGGPELIAAQIQFDDGAQERPSSQGAKPSAPSPFSSKSRMDSCGTSEAHASAAAPLSPSELFSSTRRVSADKPREPAKARAPTSVMPFLFRFRVFPRPFCAQGARRTLEFMLRHPTLSEKHRSGDRPRSPSRLRLWWSPGNDCYEGPWRSDHERAAVEADDRREDCDAAFPRRKPFRSRKAPGPGRDCGRPFRRQSPRRTARKRRCSSGWSRFRPRRRREPNGAGLLTRSTCLAVAQGTSTTASAVEVTRSWRRGPPRDSGRNWPRLCSWGTSACGAAPREDDSDEP